MELIQFDKNRQIGFGALMRAQLRALLLILISTLAVQAHAYDEVKLRELASSPGWLDRLHYEKSSFGKWRSLVDGKGFFFSDIGHYDAYAELVATLDSANRDIKIGKLKLPPLCAFPERYRFLSEQLGIQYKKPRCKVYDDFIKQFNTPQSISLVFSSAYPNNPASMFGHTFLKINSKAKSDLLDQGLNFAALVGDNENPFAFMWLGVTGGYLGRWSNQPFYVKVNEYTNQESRDVWEYVLNITPDETMRVINHLWEIETNSFFDYYFFDENCSYQILKIMVAIKPEWRDSLQHNIYVIPGETVKKLVEIPGALKEVKFRPSRHKKLLQRYEALTPAEKDKFFALLEDDSQAESEKSRTVVDALALYYDYLRSEKNKLYLKEYEAKRKKLLAHRSSLGIATPEEKARLKPIQSETDPSLGHDPYQLALGRGLYDFKDGSSSTSYTFIRWKSAYHDLLNKDRGYSPYAHIEFPQFDLAYDEEKSKLRLESLTGLSTTSLFPISRLDQRMSWKIKLGLETSRGFACESCKPVYSEIGAGYSAHFLSTKNMIYALATARLELYRAYKKGYRYGPGAEIGLLLNPFENYKAHVQLGLDAYMDQVSQQEKSLGFHHAYSLAKNWEIRNTNTWYESHESTTRAKRFEARLLLGRFYR